MELLLKIHQRNMIKTIQKYKMKMMKKKSLIPDLIKLPVKRNSMKTKKKRGKKTTKKTMKKSMQ